MLSCHGHFKKRRAWSQSGRDGRASEPRPRRRSKKCRRHGGTTEVHRPHSGWLLLHPHPIARFATIPMAVTADATVVGGGVVPVVVLVLGLVDFTVLEAAGSVPSCGFFCHSTEKVLVLEFLCVSKSGKRFFLFGCGIVSTANLPTATDVAGTFPWFANARTVRISDRSQCVRYFFMYCLGIGL